MRLQNTEYPEEKYPEIGRKLHELEKHLLDRRIKEGGEYSDRIIKGYGEDMTVIDMVQGIYEKSGVPFHGYHGKDG